MTKLICNSDICVERDMCPHGSLHLQDSRCDEPVRCCSSGQIVMCVTKGE